MPTQNDSIAELFSLVRETKGEIAATNTSVATLTGAVRVLTDQNDKFFRLVYRIGAFMGFLLLLCMAALIYGAIGKDGLHSVRQTLPLMHEAVAPSRGEAMNSNEVKS